LDRTGLLARVYDSVFAIDQGRKWLDTEGLEHEGSQSRIMLYSGIEQCPKMRFMLPVPDTRRVLTIF
jgi:hypothetical protein